MRGSLVWCGVAVLHYVSREQLMSLRPAMTGPEGEGTSWKVTHPDGPDTAVPAWFSLTPRSPSIDSRVGGSDVELSATMATFGGITGPQVDSSRRGGSAEPPPVVLGGNPVAPGTPAGAPHERSRQCAVRLRLSADGLGRGRQCLVLAAVSALGTGDHRVQLLMGDTTVAEDLVGKDDRLALLLEVPDDGRLLVELWLRLASTDARAQLGVRGVQGHLL